MIAGVRRAFHWTYASWTVALAGGAALTAALADKFALAYFFTVVCCIFSIGCWLASDTLAAKLEPARVYLANGALHPSSKTRYRFWQTVPSVLFLGFFVVCGYRIRVLEQTNKLQSLDEWLYPAGDPAPSSSCNSKVPLPPDAVAIYLGNSRLTGGVNTFPWAVIVPQDRRIRQPILVVERDERDRIALDLDVRGKDERIIARIIRNHFVVNRNNILTKQSPDRSTLIVTDQQGTDVLKLRYINPYAIHLVGTFYVVGQKEPIVINEETQDMGGGRMTLSGMCNTYDKDLAVSVVSSGDGSGNHEYDSPGSQQYPLSPVRKWNKAKQEWE